MMTPMESASLELIKFVKMWHRWSDTEKEAFEKMLTAIAARDITLNKPELSMLCQILNVK